MGIIAGGHEIEGEESFTALDEDEEENIYSDSSDNRLDVDDEEQHFNDAL